jgi:hypothetical protein
MAANNSAHSDGPRYACGGKASRLRSDRLRLRQRIFDPIGGTGRSPSMLVNTGRSSDAPQHLLPRIVLRDEAPVSPPCRGFNLPFLREGNETFRLFVS